MKTYLIKPGIRQAIAKAGETDVAVAFDGRAWKTEYPAGRPQLLVTAPGGQRTPVTVTEEDGMIEGQVPAELLSAPGAYVYQFVWTQGTTQQESNVCDVIILASQLADTWANRRHTPEWAERIFQAAEVIEGAMDGTLEARHTALSAAESAAESRDAAAASAERAAEDAESAADSRDAAAAIAASIPEDYTALSNQVKSRRYNAIFYAADGADIVYSGLDVSTPSYHAGTKNLIIRMDGTTYTVTPQMIIDAATAAEVPVDGNGVITRSSFAIYLDETDGTVHCTTNAGTGPTAIAALSKHPVIFAAHYASFRSGLAVEYMTARRAEKIPGLLNDVQALQTDDQALQTDVQALKTVTPTVPAYFEEKLAEKIPLIIANMNEAGANGTTFVFITDLHWETNYKNSPALVRRVLSKTNVKNVFCGGDLFNQGEKGAMAEVLLDCVNHFRFVQTNGFFPVARGNHDDNSNWSSSADVTAHAYDANTLYSLLLSPVADRVTRIGSNWTFYFDQAEIKTRYIFVDTKRNGMIIDKDQILSCLNSVASGWHVVIVMHFTLNSATALFAGCDLIAHIVSAYNNRESGSYSGSQQTATYDFTAAAGTVDLIIGGHKHADLAMGANDPNNPSGVPIIATDTDSYRDHAGTEGTVNSQCFDVVTVNYSAKTVKCVRIGRGSDREFSYGS